MADYSMDAMGGDLDYSMDPTTHAEASSAADYPPPGTEYSSTSADYSMHYVSQDYVDYNHASAPSYYDAAQSHEPEPQPSAPTPSKSHESKEAKTVTPTKEHKSTSHSSASHGSSSYSSSSTPGSSRSSHGSGHRDKYGHSDKYSHSHGHSSSYSSSSSRRIPGFKRARQPSGSSKAKEAAPNSIAENVAIALADIKSSSPLARVVRPGSIPEAALKKSFTRGPGPVALPPGKNAVQVEDGSHL